MAKLFSVRIWILILFLFMSLLAIDPSPLASGIEVKQMELDSPALLEGMKAGEKIIEINGIKIKDLTDFKNEIDKVEVKQQKVEVKTEEGNYDYNITNKIGFNIDENLTIITSTSSPVKKNTKLISINNQEITSLEEFKKTVNELLPKKKLIIKTSSKF